MHHDFDSFYACVVVFSSLRKEWISSVNLIAATLGTVLKIYDKPRKVGDKFLGVVLAKLLVSKSMALSSHILFPDLLDKTQVPDLVWPLLQNFVLSLLMMLIKLLLLRLLFHIRS